MTLLASALDLIGNTPLLRLDRAYEGPGRIIAKAEFLQPGGSVKDRAAKWIVLAARADGRLLPGMPVVEMTSGNMGAGLAVVCAALGHPLIVTMSAGNSPARARMMEGLGAKVILVPQVDGVPTQVTGADIAAATDRAREIALERAGSYVDQFNAPEGIAAHAETTGPEIWQQSGGAVDAWVAAVGTGATFLGVSNFLRTVAPNIICAAVEPASSRPLAGEKIVDPRHVLQGVGYGLVPPHLRSATLGPCLSVTDEEARYWRHRLATTEGVYVGFSAAANVAAAVKLLTSGRIGVGSTVATLLVILD